jgi:hypothetical protein
MGFIVATLRVIWNILLAVWLAISNVVGFVKSVFSIFVAIAGFIGIIYLTLWVMFIGGIADMINIFKSAEPATIASVGLALAKIFFAFPVGFWLGGVLSEVIEDLDSGSSKKETWEEPKWLARLSERVSAKDSTPDENSTNLDKYNGFDWTALPEDWKESNRQGLPWSSDEEHILISAASKGVEVEQIAENLKRSPGAIASRLNKIQHRTQPNAQL